MLFRKPAAEVTLSLYQLAGYLQGLFDAKMSAFGDECSELLERADRHRGDFSVACDGFGSLAAEPDLEYTPNASASFVKESKSAYVRSMHALLSKHGKPVEETDVYRKYKAAQEGLDGFIGDVLRTNTQFGLVLTAYSNNIEPFKRAFTAMERDSASLKRAIAERVQDHEDYMYVSENIKKLGILALELSALRAASTAPQRTPTETAPETAGFGAKLATERSALAEVNGRISALEKEMASVLLPLERPARKYAYSQVKKSRLLEYITEPASTLLDEGSYSELSEAATKIGEEVGSGSLQVKSKERVLSSVDSIKDGSMFRLIEEHRLARQAASNISSSIRELERAESSAKGVAAQATALERGREEAHQRADTVEREMQRLRGLVQQQLLDHYRARVRII